jgi:hypothetical protein
MDRAIGRRRRRHSRSGRRHPRAHGARAGGCAPRRPRAPARLRGFAGEAGPAVGGYLAAAEIARPAVALRRSPRGRQADHVRGTVGVVLALRRNALATAGGGRARCCGRALVSGRAGGRWRAGRRRQRLAGISVGTIAAADAAGRGCASFSSGVLGGRENPGEHGDRNGGGKARATTFEQVHGRSFHEEHRARGARGVPRARIAIASSFFDATSRRDRRTPFGYDMRNVTRSGHAATAGPRSNGIWTAFSRDQQITSELRAGVQPASLRGCSRRASTSHEHPQERRAPRPRPHRCHRLVGREARRGDAGGEILDLVLLEHATSTTFDGLAICSQMATLKPCSSRRCT